MANERSRLLEPPPLRADPFGEDGEDAKRLEWKNALWGSQTALLKPFHRTAEEMVRLISGQQWILWSDMFQRFVDVTELMTDEERTWRPRPVFNRMLPWFMLTTARLNENPPIITFQPSSPDRADADLAEVWDIIHKQAWREGQMTDALQQVVAWLAATGEAYWKFRLNTQRGPIRKFEGPAMLPWTDEETGETSEFYAERVPYGPDGQPLVQMVGPGSFDVTGEPHQEREGIIECIPLSPFEVRSEWNHGTPFHRRSWHLHRAYLTPEQFYEMTGLEVEPDLRGDDVQGVNELRRLMFGAGNYAQVSPFGWEMDSGSIPNELVCVDELWVRPGSTEASPEANDETDEPGGRLLITTGSGKVAYDGPRPFNFPHTSPIHRFRFVDLPGRPAGTTPAEMLAPIQRGINRGIQQLLDFRTLISNPKALIDGTSGLQNVERTNKPGEELIVQNMRPGVVPYSYVPAPQVSGDVWRIQALLNEEFDRVAGIEGARGNAPTTTSSGELVKELRFNSDRYFGPSTRGIVEEVGRSAETMMAIIRKSWDREKLIHHAGDDNVPRTITVYPDMLTPGKVNVFPDVESMLPESRSERQQRADQAYDRGLFGMPGSPAALRKYAEMARFPHAYRSILPGEVHRITAQRELAQILQGAMAQEIPLFDWYDDEIHAEVFSNYMAGPEFLRQTPEVQLELEAHWTAHMQRLQMAQMQAAALAAASDPNAAGGGAPDASGGGDTPPAPTGDAAATA